MKKLLLIISLLILVLSGCASNEKSKETSLNTEDKKEDVVVGMTWIVSSLDPTNSSNPWALTTHGISEYVYMLDKDGNSTSRFIDKLEQVDDLTWKGSLKEGVKFSDGSDVDSEAFVKAMNTIQEKNELSNASCGKMEFKVVDKTSFEVKTQRQTNILQAVLGEWSNVVFKDLGDDKYVFTGPYMVKELIPDTTLTLVANPYYENYQDRPNVTIKVFKDVNSLKLAFEGGEVDLAFPISTDAKDSLIKEGKIVKSIDAGYQYFSFVNTQNDKLSDIKVRKALDLGLNRQDYIDALKGGRIANGTFASYYQFAGGIKLVYNVEEANKLLDEAGWIKGSDGIRVKDNEKLSLTLVTYPSRPDLTIIMQIMVSQLKDLGIETTTQIQDNPNGVLKSGEYDLLLYAQHTAPTGEPAFFLNQFFRSNGASNYTKLNDSKIDGLLDELGKEQDKEKRYEYAKEIQGLVHESLPILFLVDPEWNIGVSDKLKDYEPYCGDYYLVNNNLLSSMQK